VSDLSPYNWWKRIKGFKNTEILDKSFIIDNEKALKIKSTIGFLEEHVIINKNGKIYDIVGMCSPEIFDQILSTFKFK